MDRASLPPAALAIAVLLASGCDRKSDAPCGTGNRALPEGLETISWDNGTPDDGVRGNDYRITVMGRTFDLDEEPLREAVRFDLARPARIHGFSVQYVGLDPSLGDGAEIEAGLFPDFGHNGFDYWAGQSLWSGTRCAGDIVEGEFVEYVFEEPVEITQPGLVYVAHHALADAGPTFAFDDDVSGEGNCATFDECHSSINLPEAWDSFFFNGISLSFPFDYLVRIHVEWTAGELPPPQVFAAIPDSGLTPGLHQAWGDYDNDGWDDVMTTGPVLHRNLEGAGFAVTTSAAGLTAMGVVGNGVWGDYDDDGCLDVFLVARDFTKPNALLHNECNGTFTNVTSVAGVQGAQTENECGNPAYDYSASDSAAWVDIDGDGRLDLYVGTYNCAVDLYPYVDLVYRNEGGGVFADWTGTRGFLATGTSTRGVNPLDIEGDGDVDLLVNNYVLEPNLVFRNEGNGTVTEIGLLTGLAGEPTAFQGETYYGHTLGTAWGDLDRDGDWDVVEANLAHPRFFHFSDPTRVLLNDGTGTFADISGDWTYPASAAGLRYQETHTSPLLGDIDQDGILDLAISARYDGRPTDFHWGNGDGTFRLDAWRSGLAAEKNGWGLTAADIDHDGDLDLATNRGLLRNELPQSPVELPNGRPSKGHWLQVRAVGNIDSNRAGIGSTVKVTAGSEVLMRHVQGGTGQGCQDPQTLHFGLGRTTTSVDSIEVSFAGGAVVSYAGPFAADQRLWLYEDGTVLMGWNHPW